MSWRPVCRTDQVPVERGICALVDGQQVALFRTADGELFALGNQDPFSGAMVLSRGIVGDRGGEPTVTSPMFKQAFALRTGACLDDLDVSVPVFPVRAHEGRVEISVREAVRLPA